MGNSKSAETNDGQVEEVSLDDFNILRAIGKGSFCKVCIVQKKNTKRLYAMKYMDKIGCYQKDAFRNVQKEVDILAGLSHPFLVNLWFAFQDFEDLFLVFDLLLGGDLRFHLSRKGRFDPAQVKANRHSLAEINFQLYLCEVALALDYLHRQNIVHRDIKPDNLLLDEAGHVHITDFNIATILKDGSLATSATGTKPYMAIEIYNCSLHKCSGYGFAVDWWALGVSVYEMLKGRRPYDIRTDCTAKQAKEIIETTPLILSSSLGDHLIYMLNGLLDQDPERRICSINKLKVQAYVADVKFEEVLRRKVKPTFVPPKNALNCDPTYELEEMIIEENPLHKKKKRAGRASHSASITAELAAEGKDPVAVLQALENMSTQFKMYNREKVLKDEEKRIRKLEEELGIRPPPRFDAIGKRLGRQETIQS